MVNGQCKRLQNELAEQTAELTTLRAMPFSTAAKPPGKAGEVSDYQQPHFRS